MAIATGLFDADGHVYELDLQDASCQSVIGDF